MNNTAKTKKTALKAVEKTNAAEALACTKLVKNAKPIVFDGDARKTFIEGVIQDIKGYFESKSNGLVEISYEDYNLKNHEFGFKVFVVKGSNCTKQMYSEVSSAIANAVNYMFSGGNEQYDITVITEDSKTEIEIVSNW